MIGKDLKKVGTLLSGKQYNVPKWCVRIFFSHQHPNITRERLVIFHRSCEEVSIDHITIFFVQPNEQKKGRLSTKKVFESTHTTQCIMIIRKFSIY